MTQPNEYTSKHETCTADEVYALFGGSHGSRLLRLRRLPNRKLRNMAVQPPMTHYDMAYDGDDWFEYLDDCNAAKAAREVHRARRGRDLDDILRGMSLEEREAYLYRSNS